MNLNPKTWWCLHDWKVLHEHHSPQPLSKMKEGVTSIKMDYLNASMYREVHATTFQCAKCGTLVTRTVRNPP